MWIGWQDHGPDGQRISKDHPLEVATVALPRHNSHSLHDDGPELQPLPSFTEDTSLLPTAAANGDSAVLAGSHSPGLPISDAMPAGSSGVPCNTTSPKAALPDEAPQGASFTSTGSSPFAAAAAIAPTSSSDGSQLSPLRSLSAATQSQGSIDPQGSNLAVRMSSVIPSSQIDAAVEAADSEAEPSAPSTPPHQAPRPPPFNTTIEETSSVTIAGKNAEVLLPSELPSEVAPQSDSDAQEASTSFDAPRSERGHTPSQSGVADGSPAAIQHARPEPLGEDVTKSNAVTSALPSDVDARTRDGLLNESAVQEAEQRRSATSRTAAASRVQMQAQVEEQKDDGVEQFSMAIHNCRMLGPLVSHTLAAGGADVDSDPLWDSNPQVCADEHYHNSARNVSQNFVYPSYFACDAPEVEAVKLGREALF